MHSVPSVFLTGGSKGIGAGIARRLRADGARVVIADIDQVAGSALAKKLDAEFACLDVSDVSAVREVVGRLGPFDTLINCAGIDQHAYFTKTSESDWIRLLDVNLKSVLATTHAVLPAMQAAGHGRIVNIGSEAGRLGSSGGAVYAAAKGAVIAFTRSIARESARYGITANVVAPGPVDTPLLRRAVADGGAKLLDAMRGATLLNRLGTVDEVAAAVAFLVSEDAGFITGEVLGVSGGMGCGQ